MRCASHHGRHMQDCHFSSGDDHPSAHTISWRLQLSHRMEASCGMMGARFVYFGNVCGGTFGILSYNGEEVLVHFIIWNIKGNGIGLLFREDVNQFLFNLFLGFLIESENRHEINKKGWGHENDQCDSNLGRLHIMLGTHMDNALSHISNMNDFFKGNVD